LQALFEASEEAPEVRGWTVRRHSAPVFDGCTRAAHGWNELEVKPIRSWCGICRPAFVYFAHSYYVPVDARAAAICTYAAPYTAALEAATSSACNSIRRNPGRWIEDCAEFCGD